MVGKRGATSRAGVYSLSAAVWNGTISALVKTLPRIACFALIWLAPIYGQGRNYGRSMVIAQQGIAATSQTLASQAAAQILAKGGSAIDAAIAANTVLAVVEPMKTGLGGDLFVLYWEADTGTLVGLNASGTAPKALSPEFLAKQGIKTMPQSGIYSFTVPGAVEGWEQIHKRYGKLPWKDLFQSAIAYAEKGFPVTEAIHESWAESVARIRPNAESVRVFLPGGQVPREGDVFKNPDIGRALRLIADQGPSAFYKGEIAAAILKTSQKLGGTMTADDLAGFSSEWVTPISVDYRGWKIAELPPNSQGFAALEMLNIMEVTPASPFGAFSPLEMHKRIEAMKLAYADVRRYNADPRSADVPVERLLSKEYARKRAALINPDKANCAVPNGDPVGSNTTYLSVVDKDGNIASWIESVYDEFGSGLTAEGMGFIMQNRGALFTLDPKHPNVLAGGKRPFHTIIPAFMELGDQHIGFGIMGGANQPLAHAQFASNIIDYGMNIQAALESPRFTKRNSGGCDVSIEVRVPAATLQQLSERGHEIRIRREYTQEMGRGQAILHDSRTGTNYAASDPRADGEAVPEPIVK
jgi:gamma-glutamyltranspeptidase/glutathione hydrolase